MLGEPTPADADPTGERYCFERSARKDDGRGEWADVWKRHHFAWEYKGRHANLDAAFGQLRQYALALENPPLLIVSDMVRFRIRTNWTNSVSRLHEFALEDLPEDAGLLPNDMFSKMLAQSRRAPDEFEDVARSLFAAMSSSGRIGFDAVPWFDGGLFEVDAALPMDRDQIDIAYRAADLDWSEIDPSILGTLFERGLDPDKRSQLGAHYTDRDKIMRIVEPVVVRPLLAEWDVAKRRIANALEEVDSASTRSVTIRRRRARGISVAFLERLRDSRCSILPADPATSSIWRCCRSRTWNTA